MWVTAQGNKCWELAGRKCEGTEWGIHWDWRMLHGEVPGAKVQSHKWGHSYWNGESGIYLPNSWMTPKIPSHWPNTQVPFSVEIHEQVIGRITRDISWQHEPPLWALWKCMLWFSDIFHYVMKFMTLISQRSQKVWRHLVIYVGLLTPLRNDSIVSLRVI